MTLLTVHLVKVTNLSGTAMGRDVADPYVKLEIEQDNLVFDKDFGEMVSSKQKDEPNPVYNEEFKFDLPSLENMELTVTVMDDDWGRDDQLGRCTIKLDDDDLGLSAEPIEVRRKVDNNLFSADAYVFLTLAWGEPTEDQDATHLSRVGAAAYECLRVEHPMHHGVLWNVTRGKMVGGVHQSPLGAWPGRAAHPEGHSDFLPEIMGDILSRTTTWADVLSLSAPDGRFMAAMKLALAKIIDTAAEKEIPIIVRMMFGNILGCPVNCKGVLAELTEGLPEDANVRLWVGAWRRGSSWNHAKIIAVDGKYLHTGGHNMWDPHYLQIDPIHDISLELEGPCAMDGHKFANRHWEYVETQQETFWGTLGEHLPDRLPQAAPTRVIVSEWPPGATEYPPVFRPAIVAGLAEVVEGTLPIITIGRHGTLVHEDRPSDDAFVAMIDAAETVVHFALQDLGPVCIPGTKIPLPGTGWPKNYFSAIGTAIWKRGVDVEIVLSNPGSTPGGLRPIESCYGNGWDCNDVASEIIKTIREEYPEAEDGDLRQKVSDNLRLCFLRENHGNRWEDDMPMGLHAKHFIVDNKTTYIGSQNLYVCDLAEWGVVIDDEETTQAMMAEYWTPMWNASYTGEDVDVDVVMDGLDIDRDGADPEEIDDEMAEQMLAAELANAGRSALEVYEEDEAAGADPVRVIEPEPEEPEVKKFSDKQVKYEDVMWGDLPPAKQKSAEILGYDEDTWNGNEWLDFDDLHWRDLSGEQKRELKVLGWDRNSWDHYEHTKWLDMPGHAQRAARKLGWTKKGWNHGEDNENWDRDWEDFDEEERRCLHVLGYYENTWG